MEAIGRFKQFLTKFVEELTPLSGDEDLLKLRWISRPDEDATLYLDAESQNELARLVQDLHRQSGRGDQLSRREVERKVHDALFAAADIQGKRSDKLGERVSEGSG